MYKKYHLELETMCRPNPKFGKDDVSTTCATVTCKNNEQAINLCLAIAEHRSHKLSLVYGIVNSEFKVIYNGS